jgi:hypothetical protein
MGPTEFVRGGKVIETEDLSAIEEGTGTGVPDGDGALGRLFLFSAIARRIPYNYMIIVMFKNASLLGGNDSGALRNAIRTPTRSITSSIVLNRELF